jgi:hypothetical protein
MNLQRGWEMGDGRIRSGDERNHLQEFGDAGEAHQEHGRAKFGHGFLD